MVTKHTPIKKKTAAFEYLGLTDYPVTPKKVMKKPGKKQVTKKPIPIGYLGLSDFPTFKKSMKKSSKKHVTNKQTPIDYLGLGYPTVKHNSKRPVKKHGLSGAVPGLAGLGGFPTRKPVRKGKSSQNIGDYWGEGFVNSVKQSVTKSYDNSYLGAEAVKKRKEEEERHAIAAEKERKTRIAREKTRYDTHKDIPASKTPPRKYNTPEERTAGELEEQAAWDNTPEYGNTAYLKNPTPKKVVDDIKGYPKPKPDTPEENPLKTAATKVKNAYDQSVFGEKATAERKAAAEAAEAKRKADWIADEPNRKKAEDDRNDAIRIAKEKEINRRKEVALWNEQVAAQRHFESLKNNASEQTIYANNYRNTHPNAWSPGDPLPAAPTTTVGDSYRNAAASTQQWATRQVTPQGIWENTKSAAKLAAKGAVGAANLASKGMDKAIEIRKQQIEDEETRKRMKKAEWLALDPKERQEILEERAYNRESAEKLRQMKHQFLEYQMDKDEASLTGQKFHPSAFKIENVYGEDKWVDQYGRELPGEPSYMINRPITSSEDNKTTSKKRSTSDQIDMVLGIKQGGYTQTPTEQSVITPEPRRSMNSAISDLLGVKQRSYRPTSQPSFAPETDSPSALEIMGASPRKRVHRGEQPQSPQVQVPSSYVSQPTRSKKSFHEHEAKELDQFKNNESAVMKQLMGF